MTDQAVTADSEAKSLVMDFAPANGCHYEIIILLEQDVWFGAAEGGHKGIHYLVKQRFQVQDGGHALNGLLHAPKVLQLGLDMLLMKSRRQFEQSLLSLMLH
jgi:hypothetical protein